MERIKFKSSFFRPRILWIRYTPTRTTTEKKNIKLINYTTKKKNHFITSNLAFGLTPRTGEKFLKKNRINSQEQTHFFTCCAPWNA